MAGTAAFILALADRAAAPSIPLAGDRLLLIPFALILMAVLVAGFSPFPALGRLEWREIVSGALLLTAFFLLRPSDYSRLLFYLSALFLGAALVIYGIVRRGEMTFPGSPLTATFLNRNHFAALLGMIFLPALSFSLACRPRAVSWLSRAGLGVLGVGILLTRSRGGLLAVFLASVGVLALFWLGCFRRTPRGKKVLAGLLIGALLVAAAAAVFVPRAPGPELYSTALDALSIQTRLSIWRSTGNIFLARPLLGWGWGTFHYIYPGYRDPGVWYVVPHAHNEFLQLLAEGGAVGFLIIISCLTWSLIRLGKYYLSAPRSVSGIFALGAAGALIYAAVHSGFDFILRLPVNTIFLSALVGLGLSSSSPESGFAISRRPARLTISLAVIAGLIFGILIPSTRIYRSEVMVREGERLLKLGRADQAREIFSRARRLDPSAGRPLLGRAAAGMAVFDRVENQVALYDSILADLKIARRNNPRDIRPWRRLGRFHRKLKAFEQSDIDLKAALVLDPANPFLYYELAENDLSRGNSLSAARRLRRASEIYPMIWGASRKLLFRHTGDYEILQELPPHRVEFHRRMGYQLLATDNPAGAEREFEKALELAPEDPENFRALARFYARSGRPEEARRYYQEALKRAPDNH
ncbi:MAG: tetratricopeptide repeat protein, partial [Candidatus Erginobacter occultus]|nr:tetratricopeptide repeat protein [Candidatus Erginobacter occultus]